MRVKAFIILCLLGNVGYGQDSIKKSYWDFLKHDTSAYCPMFLGGINYIFTLPGIVSNTGRGFSFDAGFNISRFFTKKVILGGFIEMKLSPGTPWPSKFNSTFHSDLITNSNFESLNQTDSLYASEFVNKSADGLDGSYGARAGFMLALPSAKYPMIKVYRKSVDEIISAYDFNQTNFGTTDENIDFFYRGYGVELLKLIRSKKNVPFYISLFYERDNLSDSSIESVRLNAFLAPGFFEDYRIIHRFGLKLGLGTM